MNSAKSKEKPIIFSEKMIQALLNTKPGTWPAEPVDPSKPCKSMTRRVPRNHDDIISSHDDLYNIAPAGAEVVSLEETFMSICPYKVGDILWVRESWTTMIYGMCGDLSPNVEYAYKADGSLGNYPESSIAKSRKGWKSPIFMPRKAARLFLEVKSVRVERLQDITEKDALAEGFSMCIWFRPYGKSDDESICFNREDSAFQPPHCSHKASFANYWERLNAKRGFSWESNPWVFCYSFMRVENAV